MTRKTRILAITGVVALLGTGLTLAHDYAVKQARAGKSAGLSCPVGMDKPGAQPPAQAQPVSLTQGDVRKLETIAFDAARQGDLQTLQAYLNSGFSANVVNARGDTLLILAVYYGQEEAVDLLLKQPGVELDHKNNMGFTALTGAVYKGYDPIVKKLVDKGANVNSANGSGQTALMFAGLFGRENAAVILLKAGARREATDASGNTAAGLAKAQGNQRLAELLSAPADPL